MIVIDQRTDDPSSGLAARKIWKALYRLSGAYQFKDLDSFLIDLSLFEKEVDKAYEKDGFINIFYWMYDPYGWIANTQVSSEDCEWSFEHSYKITVIRDYIIGRKIIIEKVR